MAAAYAGSGGHFYTAASTLPGMAEQFLRAASRAVKAVSQAVSHAVGRGLSRARPGPVTAIAVLLAACAGSVDAVAFFGLGKAFAGIVTGNLVTAGFGLAAGDAALVKPTAAAVAGFIVGELIWARWLRGLPAHSRRALTALLAEGGLLLAVLIIWLAAGDRPHGAAALTALGLASAAAGGQSIWALRIHQSTTYLTGALTTAVDSAVGSGSARKAAPGVRQLCALIAGATLAGLLLQNLRPAAPALPLVLLATAAAVQARWFPSDGDADGETTKPQVKTY
jgi:uncharacterized membrane protein YoaK (UPF0700 family)